MWKTAQRLTDASGEIRRRVAPELRRVRRRRTEYYKTLPARIARHQPMRSTKSCTELADAGCPVIQIEEPQIHLAAAARHSGQGAHARIHARGVQPTPVKGLARQDRSLVRIPAGAIPRSSGCSPRCRSYKPSLETCNTIDADVITFRVRELGRYRIWKRSASPITGTKIAIGVIDHHTLQVESPDEVAAQTGAALKYIPPERLVISSDCGMGREGMSRRHAYYKMVSLVLGTNMVRKELGFPEAECLAADERYSLVVPAK